MLVRMTESSHLHADEDVTGVRIVQFHVLDGPRFPYAPQDGSLGCFGHRYSSVFSRSSDRSRYV